MGVSIASTTKCELPALPSSPEMNWECGNESCYLGCSEGFFKNRLIKISFGFKNWSYKLRLIRHESENVHVKSQKVSFWKV